MNMKYYGSILDFTQQRNRELMRAYKKALAEANYIIMPEIFEKVANTPCARFWVSEERAAIIISAMLADKPLRNMRTNKQEMFQEIYNRFLNMRKQHPDKSIYELAAEIVHQPAPRFYMTPRTVGELIYRIKNGWYDKQYDRYRDLEKKKNG